jgi:hypothetical protein
MLGIAAQPTRHMHFWFWWWRMYGHIAVRKLTSNLHVLLHSQQNIRQTCNCLRWQLHFLINFVAQRLHQVNLFSQPIKIIFLYIFLYRMTNQFQKFAIWRLEFNAILLVTRVLEGVESNNAGGFGVGYQGSDIVHNSYHSLDCKPRLMRLQFMEAD